MNSKKSQTLLTIEPPPLARPATHTWTGPCKRACSPKRDFVIITLVSAAIAYACVGLGIL